MKNIDVQQIIHALGLQPLLGEGGLFRETYRSTETLSNGMLPQRYQGSGKADKPFGTAILYLLTNEPVGKAGEPANGDMSNGNTLAFSALHRLQTDEVYHYYLGDPLEMTLLFPDGSSQQVTLGQDVLAGQHIQFTVQRGVWQGSRLLPGGRFALVGTSMAPGFTSSDYEHGEREALLAQYPDQREHILALTR